LNPWLKDDPGLLPSRVIVINTHPWPFGSPAPRLKHSDTVARQMR
jgi:hypothetical protein